MQVEQRLGKECLSGLGTMFLRWLYLRVVSAALTPFSDDQKFKVGMIKFVQHHCLVVGIIASSQEGDFFLAYLQITEVMCSRSIFHLE